MNDVLEVSVNVWIQFVACRPVNVVITKSLLYSKITLSTQFVQLKAYWNTGADIQWSCRHSFKSKYADNFVCINLLHI